MLKKNKIKIFIVLKNTKNLQGGGFNFLNFLSYKLEKSETLSDNLKKSNIVLFNSHHNFLSVVFFKFFFNKKIFIHRVDGPISKYTGKLDLRDKLVEVLNKYVADATIFQSHWSFKNRKFNCTPEKKIIINSADSRYYKSKKTRKFKNSIIICSWSKNINKGFKFYSFLDKNLNFNKFKVNFVGNSPVKFKNIKIFNSMSSKKLSNFMSKHQVYLTGSKNDPCSNSLLEAIELNIPSLALRSGGHIEILKNRGLYFTSKNNLIPSILRIFEKYNYFKKKVKSHSNTSIYDYKSYCEKVFYSLNKKRNKIKKLNIINLIKVVFLFFYFNNIKKIL